MDLLLLLCGLCVSCSSSIEIVVAKCGVLGTCARVARMGAEAPQQQQKHIMHTLLCYFIVLYDQDGTAPKFRHNAMTRIGRVRRRFFVLCKKIKEKEILGYDLLWKHGYY